MEEPKAGADADEEVIVEVEVEGRQQFEALKLDGTIRTARLDSALRGQNVSEFIVHTVQPGDTLLKISKQYNIRKQLLVDSSNLFHENIDHMEELHVPYMGQKITINKILDKDDQVQEDANMKLNKL